MNKTQVIHFITAIIRPTYAVLLYAEPNDSTIKCPLSKGED